MENASTIRQLPLRVLLLSLVVFVFVFIVLLALTLIQLIPLSWSMGWLLGSAIGTLNFALIMLQAKRLSLSIINGIKPNAGPGYMIARLVIFGLGLLASVLIKVGNLEIFNVFSVFLAYLVISGIIFITGANFQSKAKVSK